MYIKDFLENLSKEIGSDLKLANVLKIDVKTLRNLKNSKTIASTETLLKFYKNYNFDVKKYFEDLSKEETK